MSLFISFEGGEGTGKSTQAQRLYSRLRGEHVQALLIREPGTTPLGDYLRRWLKREPAKDGPISHGAELFLFAGARAELVAKVIKPALRRPRIVVVADRYADSTLAYQGYGRRLSLSAIQAMNAIATQGITPDITFLLDCPPEGGLGRLGSLQFRFPLESGDHLSESRIDQEGARRFEEEPMDFHRRVREGYLEIAKQEPHRWCIIDATRSEDQIGDVVWQRVQGMLSERVSDATGDSADLKLKHPS